MSKILVVDDQAYIRQLVVETLRVDGYKVQAVGDAQSVRELLLSSQPDLVLLDLYLDGPDGFTLLKDIKRQYPHLPVIIVTAYDTYSDDPRLDEADGYVIKRVEFWDQLKSMVSEVLGMKQTAQATGKKETATSNCRETQTGQARICPHTA